MDYGKQITMLKKKIANEPNVFWKKALRADLGRLTAEDVVVMLRAKAQPTQLAWAKSKGLVPSYVSDVLNGRRDPSPAILDALGLERVVTYRRKPLSKGEH